MQGVCGVEPLIKVMYETATPEVASMPSCRRHKRSDRGHMSVGSLGSVDCVSPKSPRSQDASPSASAQPAGGGGGGGDSIFGSAYQVRLVPMGTSSLGSRMKTTKQWSQGTPQPVCALPELYLRSVICNQDQQSDGVTFCHQSTGASGGGTAGCAR